MNKKKAPHGNGRTISNSNRLQFTKIIQLYPFSELEQKPLVLLNHGIHYSDSVIIRDLKTPNRQSIACCLRKKSLRISGFWITTNYSCFIIPLS